MRGGIIPTIFKISESDIQEVIAVFREVTNSTEEDLRPFAVNSLVRFSKDEVIRRLKEPPMCKRDQWTS